MGSSVGSNECTRPLVPYTSSFPWNVGDVYGMYLNEYNQAQKSNWFMTVGGFLDPRLKAAA